MLKVLKYVLDEKGRKTYVTVSVKVWEELNADYNELQRKLQILKGIREGLAEVEQLKRSGKKLQTLNDFLT